jgi:trk system potassium uptake protein TrkH
LQVVLVLFLLIRLTELARFLSATRFQPAQIFVGSFAALIAVGTGLLMLPAATSQEVYLRDQAAPLCCNVLCETPDGYWLQSGAGIHLLRKEAARQGGDGPVVRKAPAASWHTALFTATSAVCVTGLTVVSTGGYWSTFGHLVILFLIQLGGLGIMTFGAVFALLFWQNLGFRQSAVMKDLMTPTMSVQIGRIMVFILLSTACLEALGAWSLWNLWPEVGPDGAMPVAQRALASVFHAVSAFCNAGLGLYDSSLVEFRDTWQVNCTFPTLIILGGLGFMVIYNMTRIARCQADRLWTRLRRRRPKPELARRRVTLHTKLVLVTTLILLVSGTALVWLFETVPNWYEPHGPATAHAPFMAQVTDGARLVYSWFLSVTARTAGFNTTPTEQLTDSTKFLVVVLMFIGASPGSTGGGIKTATFAVIMCGIWSLLRNRPATQAFQRTIPESVFLRGLVILTLSAGLVVGATLILSVTHTGVSFLDALFEATSAFGTVGLSAGITPTLNLLGRLLIIAVMFVGRVGPLTLFIALPLGVRKHEFDYSTETVSIG